MTPLRRQVGCWLELDVVAPARLVLQVAVADHAPGAVADSLQVTSAGRAVEPSRLAGRHGGWTHVVDAPVGPLRVEYSATVTGSATAPDAGPLDEIDYLKASRYAESDRLAGLALAEFGELERPALVAAVDEFVAGRLRYVSGSSRNTDGALDTLLAGEGVCRDYAHLTVALLRAMDVPARLVAVYAPGLAPMDFHAVAEALVDGQWQVVDPTRLAPRSSMVRISTGRDASDTAFLSSYFGAVELLSQEVTAIVDGQLPVDDPRDTVRLG